MIFEWIKKHQFRLKSGEVDRVIPGKYVLIMAGGIGWLAGSALTDLVFHFSFSTLIISIVGLIVLFIWLLSPGISTRDNKITWRSY